MNSITKNIEKIGWPRIIISIFLLSTYIVAPFVGIPLSTALADTFVRFGMNAILVLSLMPMIESGTGLNFGMPLGIEAGLLGALISVQIGFVSWAGFLAAIIFAIPLAIIFGLAYGYILNKVKGSEMMIATYIGFSSVAFMCIMWLVLPFTKADMIWAYGGSGLRTTISVEKYWQKVLNSPFGSISKAIPIGEILFFIILASLLWIFFRTKTGLTISTVGQNDKFAKATGINIEKARIKSVVLSTVIAAI